MTIVRQTVKTVKVHSLLSQLRTFSQINITVYKVDITTKYTVYHQLNIYIIMDIIYRCTAVFFIH